MVRPAWPPASAAALPGVWAAPRLEEAPPWRGPLVEPRWMRRASRHKENNHDEPVALARALNAFVIETFLVGRRCPNLFCWRRDTGWLAVEVKNGPGKLRPSQIRLCEHVPVVVADARRRMCAGSACPGTPAGWRSAPFDLGCLPARRGAAVRDAAGTA